MTDPELPQPIYPPSGGAGAVGGGTGGGAAWGAPPPPPGAQPTPPAGAPQPGGYPPPGAPGGGYGGGGGPAPQLQGPAPSKTGLGTGQIIAIIAVVALVIGGIAGVIASRDDGDGDDKSTASQTDGGNGTGTDAGGGGGGGGTGTGGGDTGSAAEVTAVHLAGIDQTAIDCATAELESEPEIVASLAANTSATILEDPAQADRFASIVVGCTGSGVISSMFQSLLAAAQYDTSCFQANTADFGTTQWEQFLSLFFQPAETAFLEQELATYGPCF